MATGKRLSGEKILGIVSKSGKYVLSEDCFEINSDGHLIFTLKNAFAGSGEQEDKTFDLGLVVSSGSPESSVTIVQTTGESETSVMSQKAVTDAIDEIWATINYVEPTISQLTLSASHSGNVELTSASGVTVTLSGFTHKETNPSNIEGTLTFKRSNGTVLKSGITPTSTAATESVSDSYTATSPGSISYVLTGTSKKGKTVSKTVTAVTFYRASYIGGNPSESVSDVLIGGLTKVASNGLSGTRTVTLNENGYVWFITTNTINKITSGGFDVPFTLAETYSYNGGSYKCYKTQSLISAGTYTYVIS